MRKLILLALLLSTQGAVAAMDANTVAEINGKPLTKEEFDRRYKDSIQFFKFEVPTKANVLNDIINFELGAQEARRLKFDQDPLVQERMDAVLYQAVVEHHLADKFKSVVNITDKEARDYCRRNPPVRFSHVYVALAPAPLKAEQENANKKIKDAQAALAKGTPFEKVVAQFSEGYSVASGGDTGFVNKMKVDPALYVQARKMKVGEVSGPVRSQLGLHLVKLTAVQDCSSIEIPEWQRMVFDEKRAKILQDYLAGLRAKAKVTINNNLIKE